MAEVKNSNFRSDIEGMRAVAIILVVLAHLSVPGFSGGFIGVDVFFVISGYLITALLVREYESSSKIQLIRFFANRLRRLMPALLTMLLVSSAIAIAFEPESRQIVQSLAAAMAAVWVSNIYFAYSDVNYFLAGINENPFLHTWSLGVEEQFYLVWPLLILLFFKLAHRIQKKPRLTSLLLVVAIVSFFANIGTSQTNPVFSFYMMPTRAWQFSAGAIVWLLWREKTPSVEISAGLRWIGLLLLLGSLIVIGPDAVYPGFLAILPTLATCALLASGPENGGQKENLLKNPCIWLNYALMQGVGRISYSWYLWHWPVFILGENFLPISTHFPAKIVALIVSLVAAVLTYFLIEKPVRYGRMMSMRPARQIMIALPVIVLLNSQFLRWNVHSQDLLKANDVDVYMQAKKDIPVIYQYGCDTWYQSDELMPCYFGNMDAPKTAVLLGDSIGAQWFPALADMLDEKTWKIVVLTKSSCPMVDEPIFYQRIGREYTECAKWRDRAVAWLGENHADLLFLGSVASANYSSQQWRDGTRRLLTRLTGKAAEIYLLESSPALGFNGPDCLIKNKSIEGGANNCTSILSKGVNHEVEEILKSVSQEYKNVHWIEAGDFVCPGGLCKAMRDDVIVFRDEQHLTASFAASMGSYFHKKVGAER